MSNDHKATLGGGCFWCVEAAFEIVDGVSEVVSGYSGGHSDNPTYREVCSGNTGHAEVVQLTYDPAVVSYRELLEVFFTIHDPTQLNRQGPDVGPQYRSIILYHDQGQKNSAESLIEAISESDVYDDEIVTQLEPFEEFYRAEDNHQNYFEKNPNQAYCRRLIPPKIKKLKQEHPEVLSVD